MLSSGEVGDETPAVREQRASVGLTFFKLLSEDSCIADAIFFFFLTPTRP